MSPRPCELVDGIRRIDSQGIEDLVGRVAGGIAARGVRAGDAVAWQLSNGVNAAILFRACWRRGAVAVPVLASMGSAERDAALSQVDPAFVVPLSREESGDPDSLLSVLDGPPIRAGAVPCRPASVAVVLFTSGSTGNPKAVLHTHRSLSFKATLMAAVHGLGRHDAVLVPAPMAHVSGLLNGVLVPGAAGMRSVYMARFDPERAVALVEEERISFMAGPPTFFVAMTSVLEGPGTRRDVSTMSLISTGGASVTPAFVDATSDAFGCRVKRTYGSTEAPTVTTSTASDPPDRARDTDGRAVGEVELSVVDPQSGSRCVPGEAGELWVRGPELFAGYADPAQNAVVVERGGWFRTGDLATVDSDGWLCIVGRLKDVIIRGGENIAAAEVEAVLETHPAVRQAVVVGYPDELMGEKVCAFVVADEGFDLEQCRRWFESAGVSKFKTPERIVRVESLPLLGSGKADRAALKARAAAL